jgi:predicted N-acetyltransferase YhbS
MKISVKHYPSIRICDDFFEVIRFLKKHGAKGFNKNWHWARWEWLLGHLSLDQSTLPSIGIFTDNDEIVGIVTHDMRNPAYIILNPQYHFLKPEMVDYAASELSHNGISEIFVDEKDEELISIVKEKGYSLTENNECVLAIDCSQKLSFHLESNFCFTDYETDKNLKEYVKVIHKGFENKGEPAQLSESDLPERPHYNPKLALFIAAENGEYAAHCGTWYTPDTEVCYVEPVATIPEYRKQGLGKAVVCESINRCRSIGAKTALVISNQQFYYRVGLQKYSVHRRWEKKIK